MKLTAFQRILFGLVFTIGVFSSGFVSGSSAARPVVGLYSLLPGAVVSANDFNSVVEHVLELERKMAGVQKQVTILHARTQSLAK